MSNRKRSQQIIVRCTPEEKQLIDEKTTLSKLSRTDFIIQSITGKEITVIEDLKPILFELHREGVNLNQCLRVANYDEKILPELNEAIKNCNELYLKLFEIHKKISLEK